MTDLIVEDLFLQILNKYKPKLICVEIHLKDKNHQAIPLNSHTTHLYLKSKKYKIVWNKGYSFIYKPYKKYLLTFSRILLGLIFIYFSFDKILDPLRFAELTTNYDIIPYNFEYFGALVLPWVEMLIGLFLLT